MSDLISRQDTIDRINEYIEEYSEIDSDGNHSEKWCAMQEAKMTIENMPSAQPATNCSEIPNSSTDCISRQAAIDAVLGVVPYDEYWKEQIEKAVNALPSAQSPHSQIIKKY